MCTSSSIIHHHTSHLMPILLLLTPHHLLHLAPNTPTLSELLPHRALRIKRPANLLRSASNRALGRELLSDPSCRVERRACGICGLLAGVRVADQIAAGGVRGGVLVDACAHFGFFEAAGGEAGVSDGFGRMGEGRSGLTRRRRGPWPWLLCRRPWW